MESLHLFPFSEFSVFADLSLACSVVDFFSFNKAFNLSKSLSTLFDCIFQGLPINRIQLLHFAQNIIVSILSFVTEFLFKLVLTKCFYIKKLHARKTGFADLTCKKKESQV